MQEKLINTEELKTWQMSCFNRGSFRASSFAKFSMFFGIRSFSGTDPAKMGLTSQRKTVMECK